MDGEPSLLAEALHIERICLAVTSATLKDKENVIYKY